ncbi:MAG: hypothetical protein ACREQI_05645 [Candidatus Binataceae bacterium]
MAVKAAKFERHGFIEASGNRRKAFDLRISNPVRDTDDYYCRVECQALFTKEIKIYGVDPSQASELAIRLVRKLVEGKRLVDKSGCPISLDG